MFPDRLPRKENMHGVMVPQKKCSGCGLVGTLHGGTFVRGTSRHNPGRWLCADCKNRSKQED